MRTCPHCRLPMPRARRYYSPLCDQYCDRIERWMLVLIGWARVYSQN